MNRLCEFDCSSGYCFEHTFISIAILKLNIRKQTAEILITLGYFDVAAEMMVVALQESDQLHSNGFTLAYTALEQLCRKQLGNLGLKIPNIAISELMSAPNRQLSLEAFERLADLCTLPNNYIKKMNMYQDCYDLALAMHAYVPLNDLMRIRLKQFLVAKEHGFKDQARGIFEKMTQLLSHSGTECDRPLLISFKLNLVRNLLDKVQEVSGYWLQANHEIDDAKAELKDIMESCFAEKAYSYPILQECLRMRAALESAQQGNPSKWIYFSSKLAMTKESYKLDNMTLFEIDSSNISRELAYDLSLQNVDLRSETLTKELLSSIPVVIIEDVMKSEDMSLVSQPLKLSGKDIADQVQVFEKELDHHYWPRTALSSEQKLAQLLALSDSGYKWGIDTKSFEIPEIPAGVTCIQWLQTTESKDAWTSTTPDDQNQIGSSLYQAYLYSSHVITADDAQSTPILVLSKPIPSSVLSLLAKKADSLLISIKRWNVVKDDKFKLEAESNWKSLLKTVSSFWSTTNAEEVLDFIAHLPIQSHYPQLSSTSVRWLCYVLDVRVGAGYGGDIAKLPTQDLISTSNKILQEQQEDQKDEQAIFFEWIVKQATQ